MKKGGEPSRAFCFSHALSPFAYGVFAPILKESSELCKKNVEYWALYDKVLEKAKKLCPDIQFIWIKGHEKSSDFNSQMNNLADKLAVEASNEI